MKKIIILLLCCGVLMNMAGCGGDTAPPPTESPQTTVSETVITETPPVTAVEPTEKGKEPVPTESKEQATEPTVTATEPTTTTQQKEKPKTTKPTESSAAEITESKKETPSKTEQEEIYVGIQWPEVDTAEIEKLVIEKINAYRIAQGDTAATMLPGLTEVARLRAKQLTTNFAHTSSRAVCEKLKYGEYVDWSLYGIEGEENYHTANVREAIGKGNWGGTADEIAYSIANGFRNSKGHWSYVGSSKYTYMSVGVMYDGYYWYVCVCMDSENTDLK